MKPTSIVDVARTTINSEFKGFSLYPIALTNEDLSVSLMTERLMWAFAHSISPKQIARSLSTVLVNFPAFVGRPRLQDASIVSTGPGIPIATAVVDSDPFFLARTLSPRVSLREVRGMVNFFDPLPEVFWDSALVSIKITQIKGGGTILGLASNHAAGDLDSLIYFMRNWGIIDQGATCGQSPSNYRARATFENIPSVDDITSHAKRIHRLFSEAEASRSLSHGDDHTFATIYLDLPSTALRRLQREARGNASPGSIVSKVDIATAIAYVLGQNLVPAINRVFSVTNLRGISGLSSMIEGGLCGNGILAFPIDVPDFGGFSAEYVGAVAHYIRRGILSAQTAGQHGLETVCRHRPKFASARRKLCNGSTGMFIVNDTMPGTTKFAFGSSTVPIGFWVFNSWLKPAEITDEVRALLLARETGICIQLRNVPCNLESKARALLAEIIDES